MKRNRGLARLTRLIAPAAVLALAGALLTQTAATAAAQGGPSILSFSPPSGPVGTRVKITGTGFVKGDVVTFGTSPSSGGVQAGKPSVNAAGTQITVKVPALAPTGLITVIDPTGLEAQSPEPFSVTQGLTASPAEQWPGLKVTFEGSAFTPDSAITLTMNGTPFADTDSDSNGNFTVGYHVPPKMPPGTYDIGVLNFNDFFRFSISSNWPEYGQNPDHTGADPFELFLTESHVAAGLKTGLPFSVSPYLGSTSEVIASPSLVGNVAYVVAIEPSDSTSKLLAFNRTTRALDWASTPFGSSTSAPAVDGGHIFVASTDSHVYSFPTSCGNPCSPNWTSALAGGEFHASSPVTYNGDVFVGATDGKVYAYPEVCSGTCSPLWVSAATGGAIYGSPAVDDGMVFAGSSDDTLYAYSVTCKTPCAPTWVSQPTGGGLMGSPAVDGSTVFALSGDGKLYAFPEKCTKSPCAPTWVSDPMSTGNDATPAVAGGRVYIAEGSAVYGYPESCTYPCPPAWQSQAEPGLFQGASAIANGVLYADNPLTASGSGTLYAFNIADSTCTPNCAPIWNSGAAQAVSDPAVSGAVWVGAADGGFYASS